MSYPQGNLDFTYSGTDADAFPQPGTVVPTSDGLKMVCVYNAGAGAIADADAVGVFTTLARGHVSVTDATMFEVVDGTTPTQTAKAFAGVAVGAIAAGSYGWLIAQGMSTTETVTTDGSVISGGGLVLKDATKTLMSPAIASSQLSVGYALAANASTTLTGFVIEKSAFLY